MGTGHAESDDPRVVGTAATTSCIKHVVVEAFPLRTCGMDLALFYIRKPTAFSA